jgi:hypothetical protein
VVEALRAHGAEHRVERFEVAVDVADDQVAHDQVSR